MASPVAVENEGDAPRPRFEAFGPAALAAEVPPMRWMVRGIWPENSHGPLAGAKKSFKSWNALALGIAVASGEPYLGEFKVEKAGPVLYLNGEGGMAPFQRRYQRLCESMNVDPAAIPVHAVFETSGLDDATLRNALKEHLRRIEPVLVILDPLYVYHPAGIEASNLYERGRMLGMLSQTIGHETALIVVDHYRKSGSGNLDLDEIGQSGVAQWADSWILQTHREEPDLEGGLIKLAVEYGSRQWGGKRQDIDWVTGPFDPDLLEPVGKVSWTVEKAAGIRGRSDRKPKLDPAEWEAIVLDWIERNEKTTKTKIIGALKTEHRVGEGSIRTAFDELDRKGLIAARDAVVQQANGPKTQTVWVVKGGKPRIRVST